MRASRRISPLLLATALALAACHDRSHHAAKRKGPPPPVGTAVIDEPPPPPPPPVQAEAPAPPPREATPPPPPVPPRPRPRPVVKESPKPSLCGGAGQGKHGFSVQGVDPSDVLNVRAAPEASSAILGDLPPDATGISVIAVKQRPGGSSWQKVECGKLRGWVNGKFLTREKTD